MPPDNKYELTGWAVTSDSEDLTMPSGQRALVRRPGLKNLIKSRVLDNGDLLLSIVDTKHVKRARGDAPPSADQLDVQKLLSSPDNLEKLLGSIDAVVMYVVLQPALSPVPEINGSEIPIEEREPGAYIDMVSLEDKMFIFNYSVGGSSDLTSFRGEIDELAGSLANGKPIPRKAKRSTGSKTPR